MNIPLTPTERELLSLRQGEDLIDVSALTVKQMIDRIESKIEFQESDHGDWLRAKEWREAKPGLISKLRRALLQPV